MVRKSSRVKRNVREMMNDDDRISRLPDDVIHRIFSFIDTRSVIQSSLLSRRWRHTWKSHTRLNIQINPFPNQPRGSKFSYFVRRFLSMRDGITELSTIDLRSNSISLSLLKKIIIYAMSHRTRNLKIVLSGHRRLRRCGFDLSLFRSQFLQHLVLSIGFGAKISPPLTWDFPALTTLNLDRVTFTLQPPNDGASKSIDLFSQFPNLKALALDSCMFWNIDTFIITSTKLESLSLIDLLHLPEFVVSAPKLSSFTYDGNASFSLLANDLLSLKTVNFQIIYHRYSMEQQVFELMINNFQQLYKANSLILNLGAWQLLSDFPELLKRQNCPFRSLQSLTLVSQKLPRSMDAFQGVISYFCRSSPAFKFNIEFDPTTLRI